MQHWTCVHQCTPEVHCCTDLPAPSASPLLQPVLDVWTYPDPALLGENIRNTDVTGYGVEALDGSIGKIDEATYDTGPSYLIVDTSSWLHAGKTVMLPAGVVLRVTTDDEKVYVNRTKDEVKDAPELEDYKDAAYREKLGSYYGPGGPGYRDLPRDSKGRYVSPE